VRYFGGTLLGTGGLITAYRSATAEMISHARVIVRFVEVKVRLLFPYDMLNTVMKILKEESLAPGESDYNTLCTLVVKVRASSLDKLTGRVKMVAGLQYECLKMDD
jgi:putative IMPACT (imprinted ancient) family translation regulator